jgi:hypothetical protein
VSYSKEVRTQFANRAFVISELVNVKFRNQRFTGAVTRIVKVEPPATESTGGGKMARETITLVPESDRVEGNSIVVGFLDVGKSSAELRPYDMLEERHRQRFGSLPFDLDRVQYNAFIDEMQRFLVEEGMTVQTAVESESAPTATQRTASQPSVRTVSMPGKVASASTGESGGGGLGIGAVIFGVIVGVGIGVVMMLLLK